VLLTDGQRHMDWLVVERLGRVKGGGGIRRPCGARQLLREPTRRISPPLLPADIERPLHCLPAPLTGGHGTA
jgi:hypothetical protein